MDNWLDAAEVSDAPFYLIQCRHFTVREAFNNGLSSGVVSGFRGEATCLVYLDTEEKIGVVNLQWVLGWYSEHVDIIWVHPRFLKSCGAE